MWGKGALRVSVSCCGKANACKGRGSALLPALGTRGTWSKMPITAEAEGGGWGVPFCSSFSLLSAWIEFNTETDLPE